jgi:hypothetical protein
MPTFLPPLNGVTYSEAYAEAAAYASITRVMLMTYELWHPVMSAPVRVVVNQEAIDATLEDTAPRNAGEEVHFIASSVQAEIPEESDGSASPTLQVHVANVTRQLKQTLDAIRESNDPTIRDARWQLIERVYASDDLTGPHRLPVFKLTVIRVATSGNRATLTAAYRDSANTAIPSATFTPERYPGLQS